MNHRRAKPKAGGIDIAWKNGPSGLCIMEKEPRFFLLNPEELLKFQLPSGVYLLDAPLTPPGKRGLREVDRLIRKVTGIAVLPLMPPILKDYLPFRFLKAHRGESIFLESFTPYLRAEKLKRARFKTLEEYRRAFLRTFGFLPQPPSPHLMDAYLLCLKAEEVINGGAREISAPDGKVYL